MAAAAGGGEGITVEDEQFKRGARRTRKIARRLKRAARLTDRMASELQSSADEWFSRISHGSGAFCTGNNYDPGMFVKRGEESRRVRDKWERQSPEPGIWPDNHLKSSFRDSFGWPRRREGAGEGVKPATEEGVRPATARPQTGAARSVASTPRDEPPASRAGSMSARSDPRACNGSKGTVPTPRASTARSRPIRMLAESPSTFTRIPAVCTNRSPINLMEEYVPPYTVDRLLEERAQEKAQEARERNVRPTSVCTEASSAIRGPANELYVARDVVSAASRNSSFSEINLIGKTMKGRQETFLTTRTRTPRALGSPDDCGLPMWMEREQRRRDLAHEQAQVQKIVDEHEKQRLAQAKAALTKTRPKTSSSGAGATGSRPGSTASSAVQYDRVRHIEQTHHQMGMRSRGVICHTYRHTIAKPMSKLVNKELKGAGVTSDTIMVRGGPGNALLVSEKGPAVPIWHKKGEFTELVIASRTKHQNYRPWFFYGA